MKAGTARESALRVNGARLWDSLMDMARIGATPAGGCNRQALTDLDRQGRDLFTGWCRDAGCSIRIDTMGNIFAQRAGQDAEAPPVFAGSHLDTQPAGGRFDGVYGVLAGLEAVRALNEARVETEHPVEVVCWTNEEGARFAPAMIGSGVWGGAFTLDYAHARTDKSGVTLGAELARIGYLGDTPCAAGPVKAAFEVHIEQGPILEQEKLQIGVLTGVQGMRWYDLVLEGEACHAGATPMEIRRDPVKALGLIVSALYELVATHAPWARLTFGTAQFAPGSRNTVPQRVTVSIDLRHPQQATLDTLEQSMRDIVAAHCAATDVRSDLRVEWNSPPVEFAPQCIGAVQRAVERLGYSNRRMVSGAGHDSVYVSRVAPTSMIFVPCERGLSHNEQENARPEDLEAGCNVLLHAMLDQAITV
jgi:N-carbamoyl-L-amino-acid hydrolase